MHLELIADQLRRDSINATTAAGSGHPTSCLSCAEIMSCLFFHQFKKGDQFVLSKGHAAPILWSVYAESGLIKRKELLNLRKVNSRLEGHPTPRAPFVQVATGSLGQGLSAGLGMALGKKIAKEKGMVYVLMGDGEIAEGSVWEAANLAASAHVDNLCAIVDVNRLGQSDPTMHGHRLRAYKHMFESFGWKTVEIDGHSIRQVSKALRHHEKSKKPFAIIAKTFKGKGVSFLENKEGWHGKALKPFLRDKALEELQELPYPLHRDLFVHPKIQPIKDFVIPKYPLGALKATRQAFGETLASVGAQNKGVVVIDGDVKNSVMTQAFMEKYPQRSIEGFIAEQNMLGMAVGLSAMGYTPVVSTFAAFLSRAHDFIRMAQYSQATINIVGTHAGVSIGEDGASQMALEDLSMFLSMPHADVLYPSDGVSTAKLFKAMLKKKGIGYLRATRAKTPVIYKNSESFPIGGLKVVRKSSKDKVLVIGAGITLHEALKAYDYFKKKRIAIRVIDLYSLKPVDQKGLISNAKACGNKVVVVEDHYFGGLGTVVQNVLGPVEHLHVKELPRSGKPQELLKLYEIDHTAIERAVQKLLKR